MVKVLCVLILALLLGACALSRPSSPQDITHVTAWKMRGRVIIHTPDVSSSRSANFYWEQHEQAYHIDLFGPMGLSGVSLVGSPSQAVLTDSQHHRYEANSPEALMQAQLGWSIPVSHLYYWVRGLPAPNENGTQEEGRVYYDGHQLLAGLVWPKKMRIEAHGVSVIFIIHDVEPL